MVLKEKKIQEMELVHESGTRDFREDAEEEASVCLGVRRGRGGLSLSGWKATAADNSWCLLTALVSVVNHFKTALQDMALKYF